MMVWYFCSLGKMIGGKKGLFSFDLNLMLFPVVPYIVRATLIVTLKEFYG